MTNYLEWPLDDEEDSDKEISEDFVNDRFSRLSNFSAEKTRARSFDLREELLERNNYDLIAIDEETEKKIKELKKITDEIENRIISAVDSEAGKDYKIDYKNKLNSQQFAAVTTLDCPLLVIAGAGSGKTRVIVYKVSYLIENGLKPNNILLLTFTKKASNEMLNRAQGLLGNKSIDGVLGGTFHSFANNILRKYGNFIGVPSNFTIIDTEDAADIIDLLKTELNLSGRKNNRPFPKKGKIQTIISKSRNLEISISEVVNKFFSENFDFIEEIELISNSLADYKKESNLFDYDDLIEVLRDKLMENNVFRRKLQESIKYILVDEYQDTNNIQREIVEYIAGKNGKITVVGDDTQSIYAFRGANFENILRFPQSFPNCKVAKIEENYRSEQGILNFTNEIVLNAKVGFKKKLYSRRYTGRKPIIKRFFDGVGEAKYMVDKMLEIKKNNLDYSDFSVLTRANWHSNYIQAELTKRNIPFVVIGGIKFNERRHIKDIMAFLKLTINPLDAVAWHRILKLVEGIGKVRAKEIVETIHLNKGVINFEKFSDRKYYDSLLIIEKQFEKIIGKNLTPNEIIKELLIFYKPLLKLAEDDYEIRLKDLEVFNVIAGKYNDLEKFLSDFTLEPPSSKYQNKNIPFDENYKKSLTVSTIHSAKGLEWNTVFIPFALDGLMPSVKSFESVQDLEEERRLFYVASSRAKENLFITMPSYVSSWDVTFTKPSRFLIEINDSSYKVENY